MILILMKTENSTLVIFSVIIYTILKVFWYFESSLWRDGDVEKGTRHVSSFILVKSKARGHVACY